MDRNKNADELRNGCPESPSSRRAWIEIVLTLTIQAVPAVALLAEGVDRNDQQTGKELTQKVALLAEGVDRNSSGWLSASDGGGRPPRGGRG